MKLIQTLNEGANIPVDQLKAVMQKDPRVKKVFARNLELDEIPDKAEFLKTLKFYITSNEHVRAYLQKRGDARDLSTWAFKTLAKERPEGLKDYSLDVIRGMIKDLFTDVRRVEKADISKRAHEEVYDIINRDFSDNRGINLSRYTERELMSLPFHPKSAMRLYRGIAFDKDDLRDVTSYGGTIGTGAGLRFLKQVREGTRIIDLQMDSPSLWTTDKAVAKRIAIWGREHGWREEDTDKVGSRNQLAFVISVLAKPEEIIVDFGAMSETTGVPTKAQLASKMVLLKEGKYVSRITHRFDREGELPPEGKAGDVLSDLEDLDETFKFFNDLLKPPLPNFDYRGPAYAMQDLGRREQFRMLLNSRLREKLIKGIKNATDFYNKHILTLDKEHLERGVGSRYTNVLNTLTRLKGVFESSLSHPDFKTRLNKWGTVSRLKMTPEQQYEARVDVSLADIIASVIKGNRNTGWSPMSDLSNFTSALGGKRVDKLHLKAGAVQKQVAEQALELFFDELAEEPKPETTEEQLKRMKELMLRAGHNGAANNFLWSVKTAISGIEA